MHTNQTLAAGLLTWLSLVLSTSQLFAEESRSLRVMTFNLWEGGDGGKRHVATVVAGGGADVAKKVRPGWVQGRSGVDPAGCVRSKFTLARSGWRRTVPGSTVSPHRLAWSRTPPFHGENRGSNPRGDARI